MVVVVDVLASSGRGCAMERMGVARRRAKMRDVIVGGRRGNILVDGIWLFQFEPRRGVSVV